MQQLAIAAIVFIGGFIIMVIEIIGARFLAVSFGNSFYIWVNQIGLVMVALAIGYYVGGVLADRWHRLIYLARLLVPAGIFTFFIPTFAKDIFQLIMTPEGQMPSPLRGILEPILGSALVFLLPCIILAMLSPYMTQIVTRSLANVGRASGLIFAASTIGSIAGVFLSGYFLLQTFTLTTIFQVAGGLILILAILCALLDRKLSPPLAPSPASR